MSSVVPLLSQRDQLAARQLVEAQGLSWEPPFDEVVGLFDAGRLAGTGARSGYVLKSLAIDDAWQGGSLLGELITALADGARAAGHDTVFVFTRPDHAASFERIGFRLLVTDGPVAMLEHGPGLEAYLSARAGLRRPGSNGAIVVNANPFTNGHLYLARTAAARVDTLYLFVVREDRSVFPFAVRQRLVAEATAGIPNVVVLDSSRYAVSAATFPSYFLKRCDEAARCQMRVDVQLFATRLAPPFGIVRRFVGHEPYCEMTAAYNAVMAELLPPHGIELVTVERCATADGFVSATRVRSALARGALDDLAALVPPATLAFLRSPEGLAIAGRLAGQEREAAVAAAGDGSRRPGRPGGAAGRD